MCVCVSTYIIQFFLEACEIFVTAFFRAFHCTRTCVCSHVFIDFLGSLVFRWLLLLLFEACGQLLSGRSPHTKALAQTGTHYIPSPSPPLLSSRVVVVSQSSALAFRSPELSMLLKRCSEERRF